MKKQFELYPDVLEYWARFMNLLDEDIQSLDWVEGFIALACCTRIANKPDRFTISKPLEMLEYVKEWDKKYNNGKYSFPK